jgi:hypothetical protein
MPGYGRAPDEDRVRRAAPARGDWRAPEGVGWQHGEIPKPLAGLLKVSRDAWDVWMASWVAAFWTPDDLPGLRVVVRLYDQVERGSSNARASCGCGWTGMASRRKAVRPPDPAAGVGRTPGGSAVGWWRALRSSAGRGRGASGGGLGSAVVSAPCTRERVTRIARYPRAVEWGNATHVHTTVERGGDKTAALRPLRRRLSEVVKRHARRRTRPLDTYRARTAHGGLT